MAMGLPTKPSSSSLSVRFFYFGIFCAVVSARGGCLIGYSFSTIGRSVFGTMWQDFIASMLSVHFSQVLFPCMHGQIASCLYVLLVNVCQVVLCCDTWGVVGQGWNSTDFAIRKSWYKG